MCVKVECTVYVGGASVFVFVCVCVEGGPGGGGGGQLTY